jgi:hypothetical protein
MATTRIKDVSKTTTDLASDEYIIADGATNGTQKMARDDAYADWAEAYVAAPTTYKLAPLNSGTNKIDGTYLPTSADTAKGEWNANTNTPTLADGAGTAGDYYDVTTAGTVDLGSGSIAYTVGDVVKYNGTTWYKIDSVANVLDGSATAADGRTTLEVDSSDEVAEATGTKLVGPSLSFDGNDFLEIADDDKLTFSTLTEFGKTTAGTWAAATNTPALTDGTGTVDDHYKIDADGTVAQGGSTLSIINGVAATAGQVVYYDGAVWRIKNADDLPFSVSGWIKMEDATGFPVVAKYGNGVSGEWRFYNNGEDLSLFLNSSSGNSVGVVSTLPLTSYEGQYIHVAATYAGAGPDFSAAGDGINLYVNGAAVATDSPTYSGTYTGMVNGANPLRVGRESGNYANGHIKDVKIFNRELSASEVVDSMNGDLGFADEWGGANGGVYSSDFSAGVDGASAVRGTVAGNIDTIGGQDDNLRFTCTDTTSNTHYISAAIGQLITGKRYRISLDFYIPSGQSNIDGIQIRAGSTALNSDSSPTLDAWGTISGEGIANAGSVRIDALDGGSGSFQDAGGDDVLYVRNVTVTETGTLADLRAARFDEDTDKLYDLSSNNFIGTNNGSTLVGRAIPVYETGTWTPTLTFGGGSTGITYSAQEGNYTRIGNLCHFTCVIALTNKGSDTGSAVVEGIPFTSINTSGSTQSIGAILSTGMSSLSSTPSAIAGDNAANIQLYDSGATGFSFLDDTNFTNTSAIRFSGTYQIQ